MTSQADMEQEYDDVGSQDSRCVWGSPVDKTGPLGVGCLRHPEIFTSNPFFISGSQEVLEVSFRNILNAVDIKENES